MFTLYILVISVLSTLLGSVLSSIFIKEYNTVLENFTVNIDLKGFLRHDYLTDIKMALLFTVVPIILFAVVYYLMSFLNSKGLSIGSYLVIVNLSFVPYIFIYTIAFSLVALLASTLAYILLIASMAFSVALSLIAISECLKFDNINLKMYYFCASLGIIFALIFVLVLLIYFDGVIPFSML